MASKCPKCHTVLDEDAVCCAELQHTWKCRSCGKLSTGFVVPYGKCFMCGGDNEVVEGYRADDPAVAALVQEALQFELDMYHFYRLASGRTSNELLRAVLTELYEKEADHLEELEAKYHVHFDASLKALTPAVDKLLEKELFADVNFGDGEEHVLKVYDKAIALERRTRDHFLARAQSLPAGTEKELFRELAAEEEEHVALLEGERAQLESPEEW